MNRNSVNVWKLVVLIGAVAMLLWACSTKPTDSLPDNARPLVEIVNIPPTNSHFTQSPVINWYGTDSDGYIIMYEYAVIAFSDIPSSVDTTDIEALKAFAETEIKYASEGTDCVPACWTIVDVNETDSPTRQRVELVAGADPVDTVKQYFFVRAVDDDSTRSEIKISIYSRNNNPPTTLIKTTPESTGFYDLPETTPTYKGIYFEWEGEDKIDFPSDVDQPTFDFYYQVFGPFAEGEIEYDEDWNLISGLDTTAVQPIIESQDSLTGSVWVLDTDQRFYDLWRNEPDSDTTRVGYFVLKVTARDDAAVPDKTPAYKVFKAIDPKFENDVLVYYPINGFHVNSPGAIFNDEWLQKDYFPDDFYIEADMVDYFYEIFEEAGYPIPTILRGDAANPNLPSKELLAKYKLYVVLEDGELVNLTKSHFARFAKYLDLGGNVWLFGTNPFGPYHSAPEPGLKSFDVDNKDEVETIPFDYFNVLAQYRGGWAYSYLNNRNAWRPNSGKVLPPANDDFIGTEALPGTGFPELSVNLPKVKRTYIHSFAPELYFNKPWMNIDFKGAPNANYFVRDVFSEPIYLYKSAYGENIPDSIKAYINPLQGRVTGLRYSSNNFKTAVFGFSLWCLEREGAVDAIRRMIDWFLEP